ncbi:nuclear transport factor 2 family protein [Nocardia wallacei]|uniref:nuclear transport factor 2 family protein n=1 Tax=Nocardia wallacei TaxID=480035 RepID=UPI00245863BE|nr:nuclear transport factor 2 family protein [Nocardia wallacei]
MNSEPVDIITRIRDAANAGDISELIGLYSSDIEYEDTAMRRNMRGLQETRDYLSPWIDRVDNFHMEIKACCASEGCGAFFWSYQGTILGDMPGLPPVKTGGVPFRLRGISFLRFNGNGKISFQIDSWNAADLTDQLAT